VTYRAHNQTDLLAARETRHLGREENEDEDQNKNKSREERKGRPGRKMLYNAENAGKTLMKGASSSFRKEIRFLLKSGGHEMPGGDIRKEDK